MQRVTSFPCLSQDCAVGRGSQYIEHGGYTWRTLDGADPQGTSRGCQGTSNYLALPAGWVLAPNDATSIAVVAAHGWSTGCAVLADGTAWGSANDWSGVSPGDMCNNPSDMLATCEAGTVTTGSDGGNSLVGDSCPVTSGVTYTVTKCPYRVLVRCG